MNQGAWEAAAPTRWTSLHQWCGRHLTNAVATVRPDERPAALLFLCYAFLLLISYYILKTLREPLLLAGGSAETKSYAYAAVALVLMVLVPLYGVAFRRVPRGRLIRGVTLLFLGSLALFYLAGLAGASIGFAYYVWVGIFGVTILAQFWAYAADTFNVEGGQRLFPAIMVGAALGALAGPPLAAKLFALVGPLPSMLVAMAPLAATLPLVGWCQRRVPDRSRNGAGHTGTGRHLAPAGAPTLGGLAMVFRDRYLLLVAALVVLLNCVNATGTYMLTEVVLRRAAEAALYQDGFDAGSFIAAFYGRFFFAVNAVTLLVQLLIVPRMFRRVGVHGALVILPLIAVVGYGLVALAPALGILKLVKIIENGIDYSIMNTCRQALYLPLSAQAKYEGKMAIDTFFWRLGDLLQAAVIFAGAHWLALAPRNFALLNVVLASLCAVLALELAKQYHRQVWGTTDERPPRLFPGIGVRAARWLGALEPARTVAAVSVLSIAALTAAALL
jgi:ATP:ADP antiporter, AAA family